MNVTDTCRHSCKTIWNMFERLTSPASILNRRRSFNSKWPKIILPFMLAAVVMLALPAYAEAQTAVTVKGNGVSSEITFSQADLEAMQQVQAIYSTVNTWPTKKWYVAQGVRLSDLLSAAGITEDAKLIKIKSIDGFTKTLTREQLDSPRYYYPGLKENHEYYGYIPGSPDGAQEVETLLALKAAENSVDPADMTNIDAPLLIMGQRWVTEQTNELFVKYVRTIEVSTSEPSRWEKPSADVEPGLVVPGTRVVLSTPDMDGDSVYYTTDGSEPSIESPMYNWIKKRWWSSRADELEQINAPIEITRNTTIKAIAVGPGQKDSQTAVFEYLVSLNEAPQLSADVTDNELGRMIEIKFNDDEDWRQAVTGVYIDGSLMDAGDYYLENGVLRISEGFFSHAGEYAITIEATGYEKASVIQTINENGLKSPPLLNADATANVIGEPIEITFVDDPDWRTAISEISVNGTPLNEGDFSQGAGFVCIKEFVLKEIGDHLIVVKADGYLNAAISQAVQHPVSLNAPVNGQIFAPGSQVVINGAVAGSTAVLTITVSDPGEQVVFGPEQVVVQAGAFSTSFNLPDNCKKGVYKIEVDGGVVGAVCYSFEVKKDGDLIDDEDVVLTIKGSRESEKVEYTLKQLEAMPQYQQVFSAINTWPTKKWYVGKGVLLRDLLSSAGMSGDAGAFRISSRDGYTITLTAQELLYDQRYLFPNFKNESSGDSDGHTPGSTAGKRQVQPMLALVSAEGSQDPSYMNDLNSPLFMLGQRAVTEQTGQLFVKNVATIELLYGSPGVWDEPRANPGSGEVASGTLVALSNANMDDDKIYYTLDGTNPTIESTMYNWIAKRWWSARGEDTVAQINHPIEITKDTVIKAVTIGPGKYDSTVATFTYKISRAANEVAEKITPGEGGTVALEDLINLVVPPGALSESGPVEIAIIKISAIPGIPEGAKLASGVFQINVSGQAGYLFAKKPAISMKFDPRMVGEDEVPAIFNYDEILKDWIIIGGSVDGDRITAETDSVNKIAVMVIKKKLEKVLLEKPEVKAPASGFNDIAGHWAEELILKLASSGVVSGYPDGSFRPDGHISRAEFVTVLAKLLKISPRNGSQFSDTEGHWAREYIAAAYANGFASGNEGYFYPDDCITREQMAVMVFKAAKLNPKSGSFRPEDLDAISKWAGEAVTTLICEGILSGYSDNTIRPQGLATRAEAVAILSKLLERLDDLSIYTLENIKL